ncbi:MAG: PAS domain-containing sensor histidine kinase [Gloeobacterales cyanobacterium]
MPDSSFDTLSLSSSLEALPLYNISFTGEASFEDLASYFRKYPTAPGILIFEKDSSPEQSPFAVVSRRRFLEWLSYCERDPVPLYKKLTDVPDFWEACQHFLQLEGQACLGDGLIYALQRPDREAYEPIVLHIALGTRLLDMDDLLIAHARVSFKQPQADHKESGLLQYAEERGQFLFAKSPVPIWVHDVTTLKFLAVNESMVLHYGYTQEEFLNMTLRDIRPLESLPSLLQDSPQTTEHYQHCKKDGTLLNVHTTSMAFLFEGKPANLVVVQEMTIGEKLSPYEEQHPALARAKQLETQMEELRKLSQIKDDFLSTVAHELRTPLNNMNLAITMLKTTTSEKSRDRYMRILQEECAHETTLINDLLDLQRLEAGARRLEPEWIPLHDWLPCTVEPFYGRMQQVQQQLILDIQTKQPLMADRSGLERIVVELVNNACKYTPVDGTILVSAKAVEHSDWPWPVVELSVQNSGPGIAPDELEHIFERFYRGAQGESSGQVGTGLGLSLVHKLVEQMGGKIRVQSGDGQTLFTVTLPLTS